MKKDKVLLHFAPEKAVVPAYAKAASKFGRTLVVIAPNPDDFDGLGVRVVGWNRGEGPEALGTRLLGMFGKGTEAFTTSELCLPEFAIVNDLLGEAQNPTAVYSQARDKWHMKEAWLNANVPTAKARLFNDADQAAASPPSAYPLIVKPRTGFASCGVRKVTDQDTFRGALKKLSQINRLVLEHGAQKSSGVIIEEFIDGPEFAVDTLWSKGEPRIHFVMSREPMHGTTFPDSLYYCDPALPTDKRRVITTAVEAAGRALGIMAGSTHTELRLKMVDGALAAFIIESTPRAGVGGLFHYAFSEAYGWSTIELALLAELPELSSEFDHFLSQVNDSLLPQKLSYYYQPLRTVYGRVKEVIGVEELLSLGFASRVDLFCKPGSLLVNPELSLNYWAWVLGGSADAAEMAEQMKIIDQTLSLTFA